MKQPHLEDDRCYAEISLTNLKHNIKIIRRYIQAETKICAVVKANAYGHGAVEVANCCSKNGIEDFAVACLSEARELRDANIKGNILILGPSLADKIRPLCELHIQQTISSLAEAQAFSQAWQAESPSLPPLQVHVKLDTGLTRHGFAVSRPEDLENTVKDLQEATKLPGLVFKGLFTHFASAAARTTSFINLQISRFNAAIKRFKKAGLHFPLIHSANSAMIYRKLEQNSNMVRPGIMLYGSRDGDFYSQQLGLKPVMTLRARISAIRQIYKGDRVSYGGTFIAPEDMPIAIMECGYADGLLHTLSDRAIFKFQGQPVRQIGRICMDRCMLDLRHIHNMKIGDYVTIFGGSGENYIDPKIQAERAGTIAYELFSLITPRVPRIYVEE